MSIRWGPSMYRRDQCGWPPVARSWKRAGITMSITTWEKYALSMKHISTAVYPSMCRLKTMPFSASTGRPCWDSGPTMRWVSISILDLLTCIYLNDPIPKKSISGKTRSTTGLSVWMSTTARKPPGWPDWSTACPWSIPKLLPTSPLLLKALYWNPGIRGPSTRKTARVVPFILTISKGVPSA